MERVWSRALAPGQPYHPGGIDRIVSADTKADTTTNERGCAECQTSDAMTCRRACDSVALSALHKCRARRHRKQEREQPNYNDQHDTVPGTNHSDSLHAISSKSSAHSSSM